MCLVLRLHGPEPLDEIVHRFPRGAMPTPHPTFSGSARLRLFLLLLLAASTYLHASAAKTKPRPASAIPPDALIELPPSAVQLGGWLGHRCDVNASNRLAGVDLEPLLAGYRKKPGIHPWIGEHIGKWLHASTLAWAASGSTDLRRKIDFAASELIRAQEPDGYLGTYVKEKRFGLYEGADWDVWSHKYCLIGLLTYHQLTGDRKSLAACRKAGDLLLNTFGPGRKSILVAGTHMGMAATSVLEPMVLLHRATGDERYLEFCRSIVKAWDEPGGPRIISSLRETGRVNKTANAKAYEMLSNLVGLCELARETGDAYFLEAAVKAWEDIVAKRLYVTGSASQGEHFQDDYQLPNAAAANIAETCVTTTWIQLNRQLLRLTGQARYAEQLERTFYNHLAAAQRPDGREWCYFTPLEGVKSYGPGISCCVSSGPRGMALAQASAAFGLPAKGEQPEGIVVPFLESLSVSTRTSKGITVAIRFESGFPTNGEAILRVTSPKPTPFAVRLRIPAWAEPRNLSFQGGVKGQFETSREGWITAMASDWNGATARLTFTLATRALSGDHGNTGRTAWFYGPFALAYDRQLNPELPPASQLGLLEPSRAAAPRLIAGSGLDLRFAGSMRSATNPAPTGVILAPFADAGAGGGAYAVWLRSPGEPFPRATVP